MTEMVDLQGISHLEQSVPPWWCGALAFFGYNRPEFGGDEKLTCMV
jgi:hypothetical protein